MDVRLVVSDMDGTLLDGQGRVPEGLWPLIEKLRARGGVFVPASGRQYATLRTLFDRAAEGMPFIAENGGYVVQDEREVSSVTLDQAFAAETIERLRAASDLELGVVLCGKRSAYVERTDRPFLAEAEKYYVALEQVTDLLSVDDEIVKLAVFDFGDPERGVAPLLERAVGDHKVVVSGRHWVDVMPPGVNKGDAVRALQHALGVTREQTVAFGDYLNDLELLDAAAHSYAMAGAHPELRARARHQAPSHLDGGVITTLAGLLAD